jgi:hypothetical protein
MPSYKGEPTVGEISGIHGDEFGMKVLSVRREHDPSRHVPLQRTMNGETAYVKTGQ